jgi:TDG/mug DNA glycosylase family protein
MPTPRPTPQQLADATDNTLPDYLSAGLRVVFCGINPGLYSAAVGHHFARPGNRFWPTLFRAGFTPVPLEPSQDKSMLELGYGLTNIVPRTTAAASQLSNSELEQGGVVLREKIIRLQPVFLAILGISAYRSAFFEPHAQLGAQPNPLGTTTIWVLPSPSGLNAHFTPVKLAQAFGELQKASRQFPHGHRSGTD